jgi:hypothetical protein
MLVMSWKASETVFNLKSIALFTWNRITAAFLNITNFIVKTLFVSLQTVLSSSHC